MALVKIHQEFIQELTDYYLSPPSARKDVLGLELPSPGLPHSVPHNDFYFEIFALSLLTVLLILPIVLYLAFKLHATANKKYLFYMVLLCLLYSTLILFVWRHSLDFDPYKVLGLNQNATLKEVRRQYRKLTIIQHPDKPDYDAEQFLRLQRAYNDISNQLSSATPEKELQIGLPTILTNSDYYFWVILGYFLLIVVFVLGPTLLLNKL